MADLKNGILDIFCGAGGLSLGFLLEGFDIVYSSDKNKRAIETIEYNHKKIHLLKKEEDFHSAIAENIEHLETKEIKKIFKEKGYRVQGIIGGPPCQGFSTANKQTRTKDNPSNALFEDYLRLIDGIQPDFVVFENVPGFLSMANGEFRDRILSELRNLKYSRKLEVLNANWYGVPQIRMRVIIIGIKKNKIKPEFKEDNIEFPKKKQRPKPTVKDAFSGLPPIGMGEKREIQSYFQPLQLSNYAKSLHTSKELRTSSDNINNHITSQSNNIVLERYKFLKPGQNWEDLPDRLMSNYSDENRRRSYIHSYIYKRLEENKPCMTVSDFRKCMFIHPTEDRGLSVREAARLQSFPDWYEFKGELNNQQQQVACAVPPLMAREIAKSIKKMLK